MTAAPRRGPRQLARIVFVAFLFTFLAARVLVFLIMTRRLPALYLHLVLALAAFGTLLWETTQRFGHALAPSLEEIELNAPR